MDKIITWEKINAVNDAENKMPGIMSERTDNQIIDLVISGDKTAFEQIFERYKRLVATVAARYFHHPDQIEEMVQISFIKIYLQLKTFQGGNDRSLASWIAVITSNNCLDTLRNKKRRAESLISELSATENEFLSSISENENDLESSIIDRDLAEKLLSRLSAEDRAILQMLDAEEMSVKEIAKLTSWSRSKITVRASRARQALRKILKNVFKVN